jgi:hypothetical protein
MRPSMTLASSARTLWVSGAVGVHEALSEEDRASEGPCADGTNLGMRRFLRIVGVTLGVLLLVIIVAGMFARPNVRPVVTPSGARYDLLSDLVSSEGHYFIKYLAHSTDREKIEEGAYDLMRLVSSNPRAAKLRTISVEAKVGSGIGAFTIYRGYGYVFENRDGRWERAGEKGVHASIVGSGMKEIGSTRN